MAGDSAQAATEAPNPPPKKRSLFSKKVTQLSEAKEGIQFFSRSQEVFAQNLVDEERRREKKIVKLERKRSSASVEKKEPSLQEEKRRRISRDDHGLYSSDEDLETSRTRRESTHSTPGSRKSRSVSAQKKQASPTSLSGRYSRDLRDGKKVDPKVVSKGYISLDDSDDEFIKPLPKPLPSRTQPILLDDDDDVYVVPQKPKPTDVDPELSDEEFPELVLAARERERLKVLEREKASKDLADKNRTSNSLEDDIFQTETETSTVNADPIIEVLITSELAGTKPLLARRKVSQRLDAVRLAWCDHQASGGQSLGPDFKDSIFLSWKGKRIYDATTCKSFKLSFDGSGQISSQSEGVNSGRVHLEAWTDDTYRQYQERQAIKQQRELNGLEEEEVVVEEKVKKIKLFLKSRELGECRVSVKPTTKIEQLISKFREEKGVSDGQEVSIHLDGDQLEPESTVEEAELEDKDSVEVHIK